MNRMGSKMSKHRFVCGKNMYNAAKHLLQLEYLVVRFNRDQLREQRMTLRSFETAKL